MENRSSSDQRRNVINDRNSTLHWFKEGLKELANPIAEQSIPEQWAQLLKKIDDATGGGDERPAPKDKI
jgi:hypothetical protein